MPFEILESANSLMKVRVMRELKKSELDRIQAAALEAINQWGKIRVLIILDNLRGKWLWGMSSLPPSISG